ncbi:glycosyltransferase involved in cell wall biosynthesis [Flavobacterium sp. 28YEA47A]|uniref:glycosyltransferase family 2 protein n=1 Tax=Flavobacterium sp. 28YEA47A TaxID=3156276 RepID=UPI00351896B9
MEIITYLFFGIIGIYSVFIVWLAYGFRQLPVFNNNLPETKSIFSIIVPFRNEAQHLPQLLYSFSQMDYPRSNFEIVFVNDASTDDSVSVIKEFQALSFNFRILDSARKSGSPKKDAITTAINSIQNEWIITTDADCFASPEWLKTIDSYIQSHNPSMIAGAVSFSAGDTFLQQFQQLDMISLQGATMGSFGLRKAFMCNGANLAYKKELFLELNGFEGNDSIASGDDVFLLQKAVAKYPEKVQYLKSENNIILTEPLDNWNAVFNQRVRWASKTKSYQNSFGKILALAVFGGNLAIVIGLLLTFAGRFSFWSWYLLFAVKIFADFLLLNPTGKFLKPEQVKFFLLSNLFYPFFSTAVALYSLFGKYEWKGRKF